MFEKVNPSHPDKIADRIAGAIVDLAYKKDKSPKIAVEVLIGHGACHIIAESSVDISEQDAKKIVNRIAGSGIVVDLQVVPQDKILAKNQEKDVKCGDNGIFKGCPVTAEQEFLYEVAKKLYKQYKSDGKYIIDNHKLTVCQSNAKSADIKKMYEGAVVNPLGEWTGGINVDSGATNRKLGSDMGNAVTGGGLHGKDLSKADVSVNIYAHILAQIEKQPVELSCAIGDKFIDGIPYKNIVEIAKQFVNKIGGFEKLAEWGLIR